MRNMTRIINRLDSTLSSFKCRIEAVPLYCETAPVQCLLGLAYCMTLRTLRLSLPFLYSPTSSISSTECLRSCCMLHTYKYLNQAFSKYVFV